MVRGGRLAAVLAALLLAGLGACADAPTSADRAALSATARTAREAQRPASPYRCFVSVRMPAGSPYRYRYHKPELHFAGRAVSADGSTTTYRYRVWGSSREEPLYVANCVIPATREAVQLMNHRFGVRERKPRPGEATLMGETCVTDGLCTLEGLEVNACRNGNEWPNCNEAPGQTEEAPCTLWGCGTSPWSPSGGDPGGGGGGGDSACTTCTPASATLGCGEPVARGTEAVCSVTGEGVSAIGQWTWTAGDSSTSVQGPSDYYVWQGPAVKEGIVEVTVTDGSGTRPLTAVLRVTPRGWNWANKGIYSYSDSTGTPCYTDTPAFSQSNGVNQGLNVIGCPRDVNGRPVDEKFIQPDSEGGPDVNGPMDGFTVSPAVPSGPNKGLRYVSDVTLYLRRKSAYNPALYADAPRRMLSGWNLNHCPSAPAFANWFEFNRCKGINIEGYFQGLRAHEGWGMNGGRGHYSAALELTSRAENDPMIFFEGQVSMQGESSATFTERLRQGFMRRMEVVERGARPHIGEGEGIVGGNWTGSRYLWNAATGIFEFNATHSI